MTEPTLDELLAEEAASDGALLGVRPPTPAWVKTPADLLAWFYQGQTERLDRARATAVDLEQRLAEVERIARAWVADGEDEFTTQITLGQLERADAGMAILAAINADHGGDS